MNFQLAYNRLTARRAEIDTRQRLLKLELQKLDEVDKDLWAKQQKLFEQWKKEDYESAKKHLPYQVL